MCSCALYVLHLLRQTPKVHVDTKSRVYNRMRVHTGQPDLSPESPDDKDGEAGAETTES